jgi:hypothetical protein
MPRFEIDFLDNYNDESLLSELRRVADLLGPGESLTRRAFKENSRNVSHSTIGKRFGGWKEALERAGLGRLYCGHPVSQKMRSQVANARRLSKTDLIVELRRVHALVCTEWLTSDDFNAHSITSEEAVRRRFGTFRKGLEEAGIPPAPFKPFQSTDEQCFENLAVVWTHYGRRPNYREMFRSPSKIQAKTYVRRWGTWRKTLKAFVEWANAADEPREPTDGKAKTQINLETPSPAPDRTAADCRDVGPRLRYKVFKRDSFRCVACGRSPATHLGIELHADHILAVANGGKTVLENLQTLCQRCNLGKGAS